MAHTQGPSWASKQPNLYSGSGSSPFVTHNGVAAESAGLSSPDAASSLSRPRQQQQDMGQSQTQPPELSGHQGSAQLSRAPTWARGINFGGEFDLNLSHATSPAPSTGASADSAFQAQQRAAMHRVRQASYGSNGGIEAGAARRGEWPSRCGCRTLVMSCSCLVSRKPQKSLRPIVE